MKMLERDDSSFVLESLRKSGVDNSWAIQDLLNWPENSKMAYVETPGGLSYVLRSGHPASHGQTTLIVRGDAKTVDKLLTFSGFGAPFVIRETPASLLSLFKDRYPGAVFYLEQRMDLHRADFVPRHRGSARQLMPDDAIALAEFFGAPAQAAGRFKGWLMGAKAFMGVFEGKMLAAIGSSMVSVPESWNLVSIETHREFRGRGYATEVVSALAARALQETGTVTVTVVKDNEPAIRTYSKIGFQIAEDRVWVDNGVGAAP